MSIKNTAVLAGRSSPGGPAGGGPTHRDDNAKTIGPDNVLHLTVHVK